MFKLSTLRVAVFCTLLIHFCHADTCKDTWIQYGLNCYKIMGMGANNVQTWVGAKSKCKAEFGHLASVRSVEENNFLKDLLKKRKVDDAWIGLSKETSHLEELDAEKRRSGWKWDDGVTTYKYPAEHHDWATIVEPNMQDQCARLGKAYIGANYGWAGKTCDKQYPYICEVSPQDIPQYGAQSSGSFIFAFTSLIVMLSLLVWW